MNLNRVNVHRSIGLDQWRAYCPCCVATVAAVRTHPNAVSEAYRLAIAFHRREP